MVKSSFEIKIDFPENATNPERFFMTAAKMIESYNELDMQILSSIGVTANSNFVLEDLRKGSLILKIVRLIEGFPEEKEAEKESVKKFIDDARSVFTKSINTNTEKSGIDIVKSIENELKESAKLSGIKLNGFVPLPKDIIGKIVNLISDSTGDLRRTQGETAQITVEKDDLKLSDGGEIIPLSEIAKIDMKELEQSMIEKEIKNELNAIVLIKKPVFIGKAKWDFKKGEENFSAKISDENWLDKFNSRNIILYPHDALEVRLEEITNYDKSGNQLSKGYEILEVLNIIENKS